MAEFTLHPRLEDSSVFVCDLDLCQVRLNFDGDLDWLLLIPKRAGLEELIDLDEKDQAQLVKEVNFVSRVLKDEVRPDKINVASLGNQVPQLHIHVIARYKNDRAWPGATFGHPPINEFDEQRAEFWKQKLGLGLN